MIESAAMTSHIISLAIVDVSWRNFITSPSISFSDISIIPSASLLPRQSPFDNLCCLAVLVAVVSICSLVSILGISVIAVVLSLEAAITIFGHASTIYNSPTSSASYVIPVILSSSFAISVSSVASTFVKVAVQLIVPPS
jgi:hypothetical protein